LPFVGRLLFMDHLAQAEDPLADGDASIPPYSPRAEQVADDGEEVAATTPDAPDPTAAQAPAKVKDEYGEPIDYDPDHRLAVEARAKQRLADSLEYQRIVLAGVVNHWLQLGGVRPWLIWTPDKPLVHLDGNGLFGALAVQILFDCSRTDGLAVCSSCGTPFLPGPRRPRRDRNIYCSDCGIKTASRDAAARYRQTKKYRETNQKWFEEKRSRSAE
jgi:DNA-directed RNA polymerase subunit RPC12/RpoP